MKSKFVVMAIMFFVSGCAAAQGINTVKYDPPTPVKVKNEVVIAKPYAEVWDKLVKELSKSFYVINNINEDSHIINISFNFNHPAEYADCGKTHRSYTQGDSKEVFYYDVAGTSEFKVATPLQPDKNFSYFVLVRREPTLEGRANIYIAPSEIDKNKTVVIVNASYVFTARAKGQVFAKNFLGNVVSYERMPEETSIISFNTNSPGSIGGTGEKVTCCSTGKLEKDIIGMVSK
jgi:hypothetical protein